MQNEKVMTKHLILLSIMLSSPAFAQQTASNTVSTGIETGLRNAGIKNLKLNLDSSYASQSSEDDKYSKFETNINVGLKANVAGSLDFNFNGGFKYQTGSSTTYAPERAAEFKPKFSYNYGYFDYRILGSAKISFGALDNSDNQQFISPFVNGGNSFIGAREMFAKKFGNLYLRVQATQARPQNRTLKETYGVEDNGSPSFFNESLDLTYLTSTYKLYGAIGSYRYYKLSADVADNDYYWGNSVSKAATADQSFYLYDFNGAYANAGAVFKVGDYKAKIHGSYISNLDQYVEQGTGHLVGASIETNIQDQRVTLGALAFRNEADTAPSFYRSNAYSNDYEGYAASLKVRSAGGLETKINYTNRTVIGNLNSAYLNGDYSDEQVYSISIRKEYDIL